MVFDLLGPEIQQATRRWPVGEGEKLPKFRRLNQRKHQGFLGSFLAIADRERLVDPHRLVADR